jgi:putative ATPase
MDLFEQQESEAGLASRPLAARMRPRVLDEIVGQNHILGEGRLLRRAIQADRLGSVILYGPPGCGKTSVAEVIASATQRHFVRSSGVLTNVAELRALIEAARHRLRHESRETILFVDEIHRFNKAQQDVLLPHVEEGTVTLIGATTHNPMFFINTPLTSRSMVFELRPLDEMAIQELLARALRDEERGLGLYPVCMEPTAMAHIARVCEGDGRRALNALEVAVLTTPAAEDGTIHLTEDVAADSVQKKTVVYDHDEDGHYDTISAFIKSVRGSDPQAAVYWLAKMLYAGEDPRFVARRLVILASEDIGNADPRGLLMAVAAQQAVDFVGMPEARITLSQVTTYLATAPKSNAAYKAIGAALKDVEQGRSLNVPTHLKNKRVRVKEGDDGAGAYVYPHDYKGHFVEQEYVPTSTVYYEPAESGYEATIAQRMRRLRNTECGMQTPVNVESKE